MSVHWLIRKIFGAASWPLLALVGSGCDEGESPKIPRGNCEAPTEPSGTWRAIPDSGWGFQGSTFAYSWSGTELLIWDGARQSNEEGRAITAAAYAPDSGTWRDVSAGDVLEGGRHAASVWTGSEWIVWGGWSLEEPEAGESFRAIAAGARFDPASDTWTPISESPLGGRFGHGAVWTGTEMLIWGGYGPDGDLTDRDVYGAAYDPEQDTWRVINPSGAPRANLYPVWTGSHMVLWGATAGATHAAKYDPERDVWSAISSERAPVPSGAALWTGQEVLAWAFTADTWARYKAGAYDPATDEWRTLSTTGAPPSSREVWTGSRVLTWGDFGDCALVGSYEPAADEWSRLSGEGAPEPRGLPALVWTGSSLLVFGGQGADGEHMFSDGAEFVPDAN